MIHRTNKNNKPLKILLVNLYLYLQYFSKPMKVVTKNIWSIEKITVNKLNKPLTEKEKIIFFKL